MASGTDEDLEARLGILLCAWGPQGTQQVKGGLLVPAWTATSTPLKEKKEGKLEKQSD